MLYDFYQREEGGRYKGGEKNDHDLTGMDDETSEQRQEQQRETRKKDNCCVRCQRNPVGMIAYKISTPYQCYKGLCWVLLCLIFL
eukprot:gnl/Chilomastix_caulleri/7024.p1 GENE.gnl/Chilomastix_caulleri/7024~~gnl/Chilomastix_caulleri/7024.p1  ORF type:complete len:85 (+),score=18.47 gnl/Chilomastix_caulleri/7024:104-358(+)